MKPDAIILYREVEVSRKKLLHAVGLAVTKMDCVARGTNTHRHPVSYDEAKAIASEASKALCAVTNLLYSSHPSKERWKDLVPKPVLKYHVHKGAYTGLRDKCTDCGVPTLWWVDGTQLSLCPKCCHYRNKILAQLNLRLKDREKLSKKHIYGPRDATS